MLLVLLSAAVIGGGVFAAVMLTRNHDSETTQDSSAETGETTGENLSQPQSESITETLPESQKPESQEPESQEPESSGVPGETAQAGNYSDIVKTYTGTYQRSETKVLGMDVEITSCNESGNINAVVTAYSLEGTDGDTYVSCAMTGQTARGI